VTKKLILFAVFAFLPVVAHAADVVMVQPPLDPLPPGDVITNPAQMTIIPGGTATLQVTYDFNNFEVTLSPGGGAVPFDPPFGGMCTTAPAEFGPRQTCHFPWQPAGFYRITNEGSIRDVVFSVPEPATWAMMMIGIGGIGAAMRSRRRAAGAVGQLHFG
jgi:hypothetical protein